MIKLNEDIKKFYIDNPEDLALRKQLGAEIIEDYLKDYDIMKLSKEVFKEFEKMWIFAESYWILPELDDYYSMIDKIYKKYAN